MGEKRVHLKTSPEEGVFKLFDIKLIDNFLQNYLIDIFN